MRGSPACCFVALACTLLAGVSDRAAAEPAAAASEATPAIESAAVPLPPEKPRESSAEHSLCLLIESAARANDLPVEFFARVIWQESRFQPNAVGPVTRNGQRAQGIAQFMPGTAAVRGVLDPFDPVHALPKSAEFLRELRQEFGNLGLAAAAYNAGPRRVREWLAGSGGMPGETRNYVSAITGMTVEEWKTARAQKLAPEPRRSRGCGELIALVKSVPNVFVEQLEQRVTLAEAKPWGVQLAAGFSRERSLATYGRAMTRFEQVLAGHDPSIVQTLLRSRGTRPFYQVRIGADTRADADALCGRVRRAGGACLVLKNPKESG